MAMDFSGRIGRVIDNPVEAQSAAMEEGHAWRVRHEPTTDGTIFFFIKYSGRAKLPLVVGVDS